MMLRLLSILIIVTSVLSCGKKNNPEYVPADTSEIDSTLIEEDSIEVINYQPYQDTLLDFTGRYLAGLSQSESNFFAGMEDDKYWQEYRLMMDSSWAQMTHDRLQKMQDWEERHLRSQINDTLPVLYPFSGPDFLHAQQVFPNTKKFVLAALEPIIELPRIDTMTVRERDEFLDTLASSLRDIFKKSYFITTHMKKDFKKVKGVLPLLYVFMERSGYELLDSKFIYLDSLGIEQEVEASKQHWNKTPGVKIAFRERTTKEIKTLYYFSISISNQGLKERPEFDLFVKNLGPVNTFVKSASYLMHMPYFTDIKKIIFNQSQSIFQDDTGIPYRDFKKNKEWNVTLYGEYVKPVKDFGDEKFQPDLDSAYKTGTKEPLPFSLGYHWGTDKQNYMLLKKVSR